MLVKARPTLHRDRRLATTLNIMRQYQRSGRVNLYRRPAALRLLMAQKKPDAHPRNQQRTTSSKLRIYSRDSADENFGCNGEQREAQQSNPQPSNQHRTIIKCTIDKELILRTKNPYHTLLLVSFLKIWLKLILLLSRTSIYSIYPSPFHCYIIGKKGTVTDHIPARNNDATQGCCLYLRKG